MTAGAFVEALAADHVRLRMIVESSPLGALEIPTRSERFRLFARGLMVESLMVVFMATLLDKKSARGCIIIRKNHTVRPLTYRLWQYHCGDLRHEDLFAVTQLMADVEADPPRAEEHIRRRLEQAVQQAQRRPYAFFNGLGESGEDREAQRVYA